ncbi:CLUMA_CG002992, isoform A [Clunio marinus]|uniref:CLUMA_CG002992, isoform A n=1 Tax=Clunio marinus TaxID=568069 RepID=A0A1J1HSQ8_9DIPT|nr:CLUMA_CG002992, isoform A [Clunio marinus]
MIFMYTYVNEGFRMTIKNIPMTSGLEIQCLPCQRPFQSIPQKEDDYTSEFQHQPNAVFINCLKI